MDRIIPSTMATQHPDNASKPYWHKDAFITTHDESEETFISFSELGIGEYKWDWEGKLVDESVLERLFSEHFSFFQKNPLGISTFLTFRLPNPKVETEFRIGRAFMNLASAASTAKHFKLPYPPLFEVILPMTETAEEMFAIQMAYQDIHNLKHPLYRLQNLLTNLRIIPLFEDVYTIISSDKILEKYLGIYRKRFKKIPPYMRPYVARSDPALNYGIIPTVIAIKIALSRYAKLSDKLDIPLYPIIGAGSLNFRGGLNPLTVEKFADEYMGVKTTTIQSAFRYDYDLVDVKAAVKRLGDLFSKNQAETMPLKDEKELIELIPIFEKCYQEVIEDIAPLINKVASYLPKRRERVQHVGLYGYSRGVGKVKLPRAIGFTGALYSLGIPPELIGSGRGLKKAALMGKLDLVKKYYKYLKEDLEQSGRFLNKKNLIKLSQKSAGFKAVLNDVENIEQILGISLEPKNKDEIEHKRLTEKILEMVEKSSSPTNLITKAAVLRKSLG